MPVWDISAMAYDFNASAVLPGSWGLALRPDDKRLFMADRHHTVFQQDMSTALDLTTLSSAGSFNCSAQVTVLNDVEVSVDGTKMYLLDQGNGLPNTTIVYQYTLSSAHDVTSASYASKSLNVTAESGGAQHIFFASDGSKMWMIGNNPATIFEYHLTTAWDISTATYSGTSYTTTLGIAGGLFFKPDGTRMFAHETLGGKLQQFDLATPFSIASVTAGPQFGFNPEDTSPRDIVISSAGTHLIMCGSATQQAWRFKLGAAASGLVVGRVALG